MCEGVFSGPEVSLQEMLHAREKRVRTQKEVVTADPTCSLLSATMNIPGPVKTSVKLEAVFKKIMDTIETKLSDVTPLVHLYRSEKSGYEYFLLVPLAREELKNRMIEIEETHLYGRLVDLDVLWLEDDEMKSISREALGYPRRTCFVCEEEAKLCGRSRTHSVTEMQQKISELIKKGRMQAND